MSDVNLNEEGQGKSNTADCGQVRPTRTCLKCGGALEVKEIGFFKSGEVIAAYFFGVVIIAGNFWLMFFSGIDKPNSSGDGKSLFLVPAFIIYILYKIKQNSRKTVFECTKCKCLLDVEN